MKIEILFLIERLHNPLEKISLNKHPIVRGITITRYAEKKIGFPMVETTLWVISSDQERGSMPVYCKIP